MLRMMKAAHRCYYVLILLSILISGLSSQLVTPAWAMDNRPDRDNDQVVSTNDNRATRPRPFVITVKTDIDSPSDTQFHIPTASSTYIYDYNVDCDSDGTDEATNVMDDYTCNYSTPGNYTISIMDNTGLGTGFPSIYFAGGGDRTKLIEINQWGTGKWASFYRAFDGCSNLAGQATDTPDLSNVTDMWGMFYGASNFNQWIGDWDTSNIVQMGCMFNEAASFNTDISGWDTSSVGGMAGMFAYATQFSRDLSSWDTSNVSNMSSMFKYSGGGHGISGWDTSSVIDMSEMFMHSGTNSDINGWDTSSVTDMSGMFSYSSFNQDISGWDTSNVADMSKMFDTAYNFDQDIGGWDVSALTDATEMFKNDTLSTTTYDGILNGWNAQALHNGVVFSGGNSKYCTGETARSNMIASDSWSITDGGKDCTGSEIEISGNGVTINNADYSPSSVDNSDFGVISVTTTPVTHTFTISNIGFTDLELTGTPSVTLATGTHFSVTQQPASTTIASGNAETFQITFDPLSPGTKTDIVTIESNDVNDSTFSFKISGLGTALTDDFVITVHPSNDGPSTDTQFIIPTTGDGYNYNVDCDNDGTNETTGETGDYICNYGLPGTFTIRIKDNSGSKTGFPRIYFNNSGDKLKLLTIEQWGTGKWTSMGKAFYGCSNLAGQASDAPDLGNVTDLSYMFANAYAFNQDISSWDTANVEYMHYMFHNNFVFNQNIGGWDTSNVTAMASMFYQAYEFNQDISLWDTANVEYMQHMFRAASSFNQDIGGWETGSATNMMTMFCDAAAFNQDIGEWDTSNVTNMSGMFANAIAFDQNIGGWDVTALSNATDMFLGAKLSTSNYDSLLIGWDAQTLISMVTFDGGYSTYCAAADAREHMINSDNWTITDGGMACMTFIPLVIK